MTEQEAKRMISKLGFKHGVAPGLISTRLLDKDDKSELIAYLLQYEHLSLHVGVWVSNKQPDYVTCHALGRDDVKLPIKKPKLAYRAPFSCGG